MSPVALLVFVGVAVPLGLLLFSREWSGAVSYTHLTLPTSDLV